MIKTMRQLIKSLEERHGQSSSAAVSEIHSVAGVWDMISGRSSINCRPAMIVANPTMLANPRMKICWCDGIRRRIAGRSNAMWIISAKIGKTTPARDQSKPSTVNNITSDVIADI